jgi:hypothetical protein
VARAPIEETLMQEPPSSADAARTPRWVKLFVLIALVVIALFIVLHLTGNSLGGPGSHLP